MLNQIVLQGRLTRDPELRYTGDNIAVATFTLACDRDNKKPDGSRETDFIGCTAWRQKAEFVSKYFSKGSQMTVSGRLQVRAYTDKDGNKRTIYEILAENIYFAEKKKQDGQDPGDKPVTFVDIDADDVELPF